MSLTKFTSSLLITCLMPAIALADYQLIDLGSTDDSAALIPRFGDSGAISFVPEESILKPVGTVGSVKDENDVGVVAGHINLDGGTIQAITRTPGEKPQLLEPLGSNSSAKAINNPGIAVGYDTLADGTHAVMWSVDGAATDLNSLITDSNWTLVQATDINDRGEITGSALHDGQPKAFKLVPVTDIDPTAVLLTPIVADDFENGLNWVIDAGNAANATIEQATPLLPARDGTHFLRLSLSEADPWSNNGPRTELLPSRSLGYWEDGDELWLSASFFFEPGFIDDPAQEIIWQIHAGEGSSNVPFLVWSVDDRLQFLGKGLSVSPSIQRKTGEWIDITTHIVFSADGKGVVEIFVDDVPILAESNLTNITEGDLLFWKLGLYKSGWKDQDPPSSVISRSILVDRLSISVPLVESSSLAPGR